MPSGIELNKYIGKIKPLGAGGYFSYLYETGRQFFSLGSGYFPWPYKTRLSRRSEDNPAWNFACF